MRRPWYISCWLCVSLHRSNSRATYMRVRTHLNSYLCISKRYRYVYAHTASGRPLVFIPGRRRKRYANGFLRGELSSATWREKERDGEDREERRILGGVEAGRISLLLPPQDRPRARIIFTEIKSKIRLALKCALDRARPNRRWLSKRRRRSYPEARRRPRGSDEDARIYKRRGTEEDK